MNEKNMEYLKESLKYMGFGENLNDALRASITEGKKDFTLSLQTEIGGQPFNATLHFRRSDNTDTYFFNKWDAALKNEVSKMQHTFYVNKGHGVTLKEGFNLLEGRAVHKELTGKEGQKYKAWLQLDRSVMDQNGHHKLRQFHPNYGYDLEKTLARFPIKELAQSDAREKLLYALGKGNRPAATFEQNGFAEKLFIEAAPQFKSLHVYDHSGKRIPPPELEKRFALPFQKEGPELTPVGRAQVNAKQVESTGGPVPGPSGGARKDNGREVKPGTSAEGKSLLPKNEGSEGLLEKKRPSKGKGLHI